MRWSLRDILSAYRARLVADAVVAHRWAMLLWAVTAPHTKRPPKAPTPPAILDL